VNSARYSELVSRNNNPYEQTKQKSEVVAEEIFTWWHVQISPRLQDVSLALLQKKNTTMNAIYTRNLI